jgi:CheY-like chemotaxis protein
VANLREVLISEGSTMPLASSDVPVQSTSPGAVLWVDDEPKNNSYFIERLDELGASVDLALSTAQALKLLARKRYDLILSDMGRVENGTFAAKAGLSLLTEVRKTAPDLPFVFFSSGRTAQQHRAEVEAQGALITNSGTELADILRRQLAPSPAAPA